MISRTARCHPTARVNGRCLLCACSCFCIYTLTVMSKGRRILKRRRNVVGARLGMSVDESASQGNYVTGRGRCVNTVDRHYQSSQQVPKRCIKVGELRGKLKRCVIWTHQSNTGATQVDDESYRELAYWAQNAAES